MQNGGDLQTAGTGMKSRPGILKNTQPLCPTPQDPWEREEGKRLPTCRGTLRKGQGSKTSSSLEKDTTPEEAPAKKGRGGPLKC